MEIQITDYNNCQDLIIQSHATEWKEIESVLTAMPIFFKASDQFNKQGTPIFDPVGTNNYIKQDLIAKSWFANPPIPGEFGFLGLDIDFEKKGLIVEVQFSNYPFLLNNIIRSELFYKASLVFKSHPSIGLVIITKAGGLPASNSTLYYEQAKNQLDSLSRHGIFTIPVRLIGLFPALDSINKAIWTRYVDPRYSRSVVSQENKNFIVGKNRSRYTFQGE